MLIDEEPNEGGEVVEEAPVYYPDAVSRRNFPEPSDSAEVAEEVDEEEESEEDEESSEEEESDEEV